MIKSEKISTLAKALVAAQKNLGAAVKDAKNPYFKSNYADLGAVIDASVPALNEQGIAVVQAPTTIQTDTVGGSKSVIRTILLHESGEYLASDIDIITAKQNDPQAYGSAVTYARRYGLQAMVTLKAEDTDAEGAMDRSPKSDVKKDSNWQTKSVKQEATKVEVATPVKAAPSGFAASKPKGGFQTKGKLNGTAAK